MGLMTDTYVLTVAADDDMVDLRPDGPRILKNRTFTLTIAAYGLPVFKLVGDHMEIIGGTDVLAQMMYKANTYDALDKFTEGLLEDWADAEIGLVMERGDSADEAAVREKIEQRRAELLAVRD